MYLLISTLPHLLIIVFNKFSVILRVARCGTLRRCDTDRGTAKNLNQMYRSQMLHCVQHDKM